MAGNNGQMFIFMKERLEALVSSATLSDLTSRLMSDIEDHEEIIGAMEVLEKTHEKYGTIVTARATDFMLHYDSHLRPLFIDDLDRVLVQSKKSPEEFGHYMDALQQESVIRFLTNQPEKTAPKIAKSLITIADNTNSVDALNVVARFNNVHYHNNNLGWAMASFVEELARISCALYRPDCDNTSKLFSFMGAAEALINGDVLEDIKVVKSHEKQQKIVSFYRKLAHNLFTTGHHAHTPAAFAYTTTAIRWLHGERREYVRDILDNKAEDSSRDPMDVHGYISTIEVFMHSYVRETLGDPNWRLNQAYDLAWAFAEFAEKDGADALLNIVKECSSNIKGQTLVNYIELVGDAVSSGEFIRDAFWVAEALASSELLKAGKTKRFRGRGRQDYFDMMKNIKDDIVENASTYDDARKIVSTHLQVYTTNR